VKKLSEGGKIYKKLSEGDKIGQNCLGSQEKTCPMGVNKSCFVSEGVRKIPVFGQGVEKLPILSEGVTKIFLPPPVF